MLWGWALRCSRESSAHEARAARLSYAVVAAGRVPGMVPSRRQRRGPAGQRIRRVEVGASIHSPVSALEMM